MNRLVLVPILSPRRAIGPGLASMVLATVASCVTTARADNLDAALVKKSPEIIKYLRDHNYHNVGILKFRVHKANHPTSFTVGPINDNLPTRLENALIAANPTSAPIGIIHDASGVAAKSGFPKYDTDAGQRALFSRKYPLAWEGAPVVPDVMLMGVVRVPGDLKSVDVSIEAFGPRSTRQDKVVAFKVTTDRALLTDLNESFQVKSRKLKGPGKKRSIELDEDAVADAGADNTKPADNPDAKPADGQVVDANSSGATSSSDDLLDYEIRYDGQAQPVSSDPSSPGELSVPEPKEGQTVTVFLRSKSADRFGVALLFNGTSTLYEEEGDPNHLKAWVMEPNGAYEIRGFQMDNNQVKPFKVLSDADSAAMAYGPNTGLIQFHIYREGTGSLNVTDGGSGDDASKAMNISLRGLGHSGARAGKSRSLQDVKKEIQQHTQMPVRERVAARDKKWKSRGISVASETAVEGKIRNDEIKNQVLVQSIAVRYYKRPGQ